MGQTPKNVSPMSNEGRNTYVIEHLTATLLELLHNKPIDNISISSLCSMAGVGRASFYRNFKSKEDILRLYIDKLFGGFINNTCQCDKKLNVLIKLLFTHFEEHSDFYKMLNDRKLIYLLKDVIINIYGAKPEHSKTEAYARAFVAYTLYGWIELWFQRGMEETAEELSGLFKAQGL